MASDPCTARTFIWQCGAGGDGQPGAALPWCSSGRCEDHCQQFCNPVCSKPLGWLEKARALDLAVPTFDQSSIEAETCRTMDVAPGREPRQVWWLTQADENTIRAALVLQLEAYRRSDGSFPTGARERQAYLLRRFEIATGT